MTKTSKWYKEGRNKYQRKGAGDIPIGVRAEATQDIRRGGGSDLQSGEKRQRQEEGKLSRLRLVKGR